MATMMDLFRVGMTSDQALKVIRANHIPPGRRPFKVGQDENGLIVKWFVGGVVLTMKRWKQNGIFAYRVAEIVSTETEPQKSKTKRGRRGRKAMEE